MRHLLKMSSMSADELRFIIQDTAAIKAERHAPSAFPLKGQCWAMIFLKSSTRTRVSFEIGVHELGGHAMFFSGDDLQLGRGEPIKDTARVFGRMAHGAIIRTYGQADIEEFAEYSGIPTVNALTDAEHPCQIIADLFTIQEKFGSYQDKHVVFVGDGDCNVPRSWIVASAILGFPFTIAAPKAFQPPESFLHEVNARNVTLTEDLPAAVRTADVVYTDVWVSMGKEAESAKRLEALRHYQINEALLAKAPAQTIVMHCLPAYRGKEITDGVMETHASTIFDEAENRLHAQKSILNFLVTA